MQSDPYWTRGVGRGGFSTSWSGRGTVRRRDAGCRWRTYWTLCCCGSSTISIQIALRLVLRVVTRGRCRRAAGAHQGEGGVLSCHDFRRSRSLSLFGRRSAVDVTGLLAISDPLFILHMSCLCLTHLVSIPQLPVHYLTLCSPMFVCE